MALPQVWKALDIMSKFGHPSHPPLPSRKGQKVKIDVFSPQKLEIFLKWLQTKRDHRFGGRSRNFQNFAILYSTLLPLPSRGGQKVKIIVFSPQKLGIFSKWYQTWRDRRFEGNLTYCQNLATVPIHPSPLGGSDR